MRHVKLVALLALGLTAPVAAQDDPEMSKRFTAERVFDIEYASDPQISPNGQTIVYVRRSMDRQTDTDRGDLWMIDVASGDHRPLLVGGASKGSPRWSPDGTRLLYSTATDGRPDLRVMYMDSGDTLSLGQFFEGPGSAAWSPDGQTIAFTMFVPGETPSFASSPAAPEGATWSDPVRVFDDIQFRFDGRGYLEEGATHVFTISAEGGSPRQITEGDNGFGSPEWLGNDTLLVVGNDVPDADMDPIESEIYRVDLDDLSRTVLTTRDGPDHSPAVSPDGRTIAFLGYDDEVLAYQQTNLYLMDTDGSNVREIDESFDRSIDNIKWSTDSRSIFALYEDSGMHSVSRFSLNGSSQTLISDIGGTSIGRPYGSGSFSVSKTGALEFAYTKGSPDRPADIGYLNRSGAADLTDLNGDILPYLEMAKIEEFTVTSSIDGREIEAWVALPQTLNRMAVSQ